MASKRCPHCGLVNPGKATACDCGYSFASGAVGQPLDLSKPGAPLDDQPLTYEQARGSNIPARILISVIVTLIIVGIRLALRR